MWNFVMPKKKITFNDLEETLIQFKICMRYWTFVFYFEAILFFRCLHFTRVLDSRKKNSLCTPARRADVTSFTTHQSGRPRCLCGSVNETALGPLIGAATPPIKSRLQKEPAVQWLEALCKATPTWYKPSLNFFFLLELKWSVHGVGGKNSQFNSWIRTLLAAITGIF